MPTIKDIAREAGLSQGTVSNVLNNKGNTSVEKIKRVEEAAAKLGYTINRKARNLRRGYTHTLALIIPNISEKRYQDIYTSFQNQAERNGYNANLYVTDDNKARELECLELIKSDMAYGIAAVSCLSEEEIDHEYYEGNVVFLERKPKQNTAYCGFDYSKAGSEIAEQLNSKVIKQTNIALISGNCSYYTEQEFIAGFISSIKKQHISVHKVETNPAVCNNDLMNLLKSSIQYDYFVFTNYSFALTLSNLIQNFFSSKYSDITDTIYSLAPLFTIPEGSFSKYELNYRLMGKKAADTLMNTKGSPNDILDNDGIKNWMPYPIHSASPDTPLRILTIDTPSATIIEDISQLYTKLSGIPINYIVTTYDNIYDILNTLEERPYYDLIRLDRTWMPFFAEKIYQPLDPEDHEIQKILKNMIDGLNPKYTSINGQLFALPHTPSAQILFYKKDVFNNPIMQKMYEKQFRRPLLPPKTFDEYNQIAKFLTRKYNPESLTEYGTTVTLGSTAVAGTEYLTRFFSYDRNLFDDKNSPNLLTDNAVKALKQILELKEYAPNQIVSWWTNTANLFSQGNIAMTMMFSNYASEFVKNNSQILNNIGYAPIPGKSPLLGGGSIGISKYSQHKEEALNFLKWLCKDEVASAMAFHGSISPMRSTYENYEIIDKFPWLELSQESVRTSKNSRFPKNKLNSFNEKAFLSELGLAVINSYNGIISPEESLQRIVDNYNLKENSDERTS